VKRRTGRITYVPPKPPKPIEAHVCTPVTTYPLFRPSLKIGTKWQCNCGLEYVVKNQTQHGFKDWERL
jgi:hypothetical protein